MMSLGIHTYSDIYSLCVFLEFYLDQTYFS